MTQEEKAIAYDKAIQKANNILEGKCKNFFVYNHYNQGIIEYIFPKLVESENEKIKKELIEFLKEEEAKADITSKRSKTLCKYIAWLEKQGQKPQGKSALEAAKEEKVDNQNCVKPANNVEPDKKFTPIESALKDLICDVDNSYTIEQVRRFLFEYGYKDKILNAAQEEMQNPAEWSEEDELTRKALINLVEMYYGGCIDKTEKNRLLNFLKSIKDRVQPQHKEWSEEDEKIALSIEQVMNCASLLNIIPEKVDKIRTWLKSLRPQNTWRPSDEQMVAVQEAMNIVGILTITGSKINSLYQDLKKLREE